MNDVVRKHWAGSWFNGDFFLIETYSGYRSARVDPKGKKHFLPPDVSDKDLGSAILDALAYSRFVLPAPREDVWIHPEVEFDSDLYDYNIGIQRSKQWVEHLMEKYGYKTKRALYKNMHTCSIERYQNLLTIHPWHHEKLEVWGGMSMKDQEVTLSADSSPSEIGAALRLAFSRCTG
jgi:hypothetical protein